MEERYKVFIAEDDSDIVMLLKLYLENADYEVKTAPNGLLAWHALKTERADILIMDIMMPEMDGYELIRNVRKSMNIPIIIISAKSEDSEKILGLDLGADDYIAKPFNPLEVVARVRSNIRRFYNLNTGNESDERNITIGELSLDMEDLLLKKGMDEINLTPTEYRILRFLMQNQGRVFTKLQIYEHVCGPYFEGDENTVMVHISNLREKIEDDSKNPKYIKTIRGLGYKIERNP